MPYTYAQMPACTRQMFPCGLPVSSRLHLYLEGFAQPLSKIDGDVQTGLDFQKSEVQCGVLTAGTMARVGGAATAM